MADMIFGGPAQVTKSQLLVVVVGSIQSSLVLVPLLLPILMVWQRGACSTESVSFHLRCIYSYSVIFSLEILNLYWDSLLFRGDPNFSLRNNCKRIATTHLTVSRERDSPVGAGSWQNPYGMRYPVEHVPIVGDLRQTQNTVFWAGLALIALASVNNAIYVILGRELRWFNRAQARRVAKHAQKEAQLQAATLRGELSKATSRALQAESKLAERRVDQALPEPQLLRQLWTVKAAVGWLWTAVLLLSLLFTLSLIIELVVVIIIAITVDP
jgi:hypothetical protein